MATKEIRDADIPNSVNTEAIREKLKGDHNVAQFVKLGAKLLEDTNKPNIITYAQFEPFIPLFNMDREKYAEDESYRLSMNRLYNQYIRGLGINLYEPTIIIASHEDPTELGFLDRKYTRFKPDSLDGKTMRDTVPAAVARSASSTRDQILLEASAHDLISANNTPEQKAYFTRIRMESALIQKNFVERNMSPEKRSELLETKASEDLSFTISTNISGMTYTFEDDDD